MKPCAKLSSLVHGGNVIVKRCASWSSRTNCRWPPDPPRAAEEGFAADLARTGEDALRMAAAHDYDAIVLDVMLPGLDGFETCRRLRAAASGRPC